VNWLSFDGDMKVCGLLVMEVLERSLDEERCLCGRMREEDEKIWYNEG